MPLALIAWALPADQARASWTLLAIAGATAVGLAAIGVRNLGWLVLAAFDIWLVAVLGARLLGRRSLARLAALAAVTTVALAPVGIVAHRGAFDLVHADREGPLGTPPLPVASLVPFTTASGLKLFQPAVGDQCWGATLCAPQPRSLLRLRGGGLGDGFVTRTLGSSK